MRRFCANCGIEESKDTPIVDSLCIKCYVVLKKVVEMPDTIRVTTCSRCGAISIGGRWYYPASSLEAQEIIEKYVTSLIKPGEDVDINSVYVELDTSSYKEMKTITIVTIKKSFSYTVESKINIKWVKDLCPTCHKRAGRSFDAVIQLRFIHYSDDVESFKRDVEKLFQDYIVDIEEKDNGYDIKVLSQGIARKIVDMAKKLWRNVKITESFGDTKRSRDGTRYAKLYISVRIINPKIGDYVVIGDKAYTVVSIDDKRVILIDNSGTKKAIDVDELVSLYRKSKTKSKQ